MGNTSGPNTEHKHNQMSFLDHLEVLRWILMRVVFVLIVFATVVFIYREYVFQNIIFASQKMDFITYAKFCDFSGFLNSLLPDFVDSDSMCFEPIQAKFLPGKMTGKLYIKFKTAMVGLMFRGLFVGYFAQKHM